MKHSKLSTLIGVAIELADDARYTGLKRAEMITAVAVTAQTAGPPQRIGRTGDLASVVAANPFDDIGVKHRRRCERLLDSLEASGAIEHLGRASGQRNFALAAERFGHVETRLRPGPPSVERGVHGHPHHPLQNDEIPIGL